MANDFNLQKFLIENKMTRNSRLLNENEEKINFVSGKIKRMSPEEFKNFTKKIGEFDMWSNSPEGIDPFNDITDRMEVLSTFEDEDIEKYYNALIK
jgi:hypothetical protein